ncbi:lethal (2) 37Cd [Carabus blaptoides fortunei]
MSIEYAHEVEINPDSFSRKLMCIEYPGMVKNVDKMINTLGGLDNIGIAYATKNRRVELRFRPDDLYCKPTCGDRNFTTALLIKVKVKRKSRDPSTPCSSKDADKPQTVTYTTSVIGVVDTIYKFNNLCDFQYLPAHTKKGDPCGSKLENIYDRLRPSFLPTASWLSEDNVPLFLTPPVFSRFDTVHYYNAQKVKDTNGDSHIIGRTRKRRTGYGIFLNFKDENVPKKPYTESLKMLHIKFLNEGPYERMKQLFEERPVWSKNALTYHTNFSKDQLKFLLPTVAYYFLTGPWRVMWVRYGYDPRQFPDARKYQTFDYRMRTIGGMKNRIKAKRSYSNYLLPYKSSPSSKPKVAIITRHSIARAYQAAKETSEKEEMDENIYIFRPGVIPPSRQMFYQYCDVLVPEIQTMLSRIPVYDSDTKCDIRTGWLPKGFDNQCREIVSNLVTAEIRKQMLEQKKKSNQEQEDYYEEDDEDFDENEDKRDDIDASVEEIEISDTENSDTDLELDDSEEDTDGLLDSDLEESLKE